MLVKLVLAQYSIPVTVLSRAMIASLIVGKVVLVLEKVRLEDRLPNAPRGVLVAIKTLFYGSGAVLAGFVERLIETWRSSQGFGEALAETWAHMSLSRFLAVILCVKSPLRRVLHLPRAGSGDGQARDLLVVLQAAPSGRWRCEPIDRLQGLSRSNRSRAGPGNVRERRGSGGVSTMRTRGLAR